MLVAVAAQNKVPLTDLAESVFAYPSYASAVGDLAHQCKQKLGPQVFRQNTRKGS